MQMHKKRHRAHLDPEISTGAGPARRRCAMSCQVQRTGHQQQVSTGLGYKAADIVMIWGCRPLKPPQTDLRADLSKHRTLQHLSPSDPICRELPGCRGGAILVLQSDT